LFNDIYTINTHETTEKGILFILNAYANAAKITAEHFVDVYLQWMARDTWQARVEAKR
jgi:hypothetical protein